MKHKKATARKGHQRATGPEWRTIDGVSLAVKKPVGGPEEYRLSLPGGPALEIKDTHREGATCVTKCIATMQAMATRMVALEAQFAEHQAEELAKAAELAEARFKEHGESLNRELDKALPATAFEQAGKTSLADFGSPEASARSEDSQNTMPSPLEIGVAKDRRLVDEDGRPL